MSLPAPCQLLTSLINTLTTTPNQEAPQINEPYSAPSNPLKALPPWQRALLTTLHVLFPPPMLLQALDLLDRGLVLRLVEQNPSLASSEKVQPGRNEELVMPPQANIHLPQAPTEQQDPLEETTSGRNTVYQVRSSQPPKSRFKDSSTGTNVYTVRLEAWNCSCAAFAFSAFPASSSPQPWKEFRNEDEDMRILRNAIDETEEERGWEFGGRSLEGVGEGGVPVCKHLLACLLGERWEVLRNYVKERNVSREEMAGACCEG